LISTWPCKLRAISRPCSADGHLSSKLSGGDVHADWLVVALTAFISPYRRDRDAVRARLKPGDFIEVFVDAPLEVCEKRDPKGLYKKARAGELKGFTGIDDPYEAPTQPELRLDASTKSAEALADEVMLYLRTRKVIR
jgi:adenylylsulfate kinase